MKKIILSVNAGSSSVKISVFAAERGQAPEQLAEAQVSGLTSPPPKLTYSRGGTAVRKGEAVDAGDKARGAHGVIITQDAAFHILLRTLVGDADLPQISDGADVGIVCHRIVHGGGYSRPQIVGGETYHHLEALNDLAPLHNAASLEIVRSCIDRLPGAANVACFDTVFHASIPPHVRTYPIDPGVARKNALRKYGFHGISYAFMTRAVAAFLGKPAEGLNMIALHLGSGASACAVWHGRSWDTSMGLTPLAGLPGATRSGSVDPSLVFHYASDPGRLSPASTKDLHISRAEEILNKESGWRALTGTADFREVSAVPAPSERHALAFDLFVDRVCGFVGSYYVALEGAVDALVFAGGIGERSARLREAVTERAACLGFGVDTARNEAGVKGCTVTDVGAEGSRHRTLVCVTDEQFEMARGCAEDERLW